MRTIKQLVRALKDKKMPLTLVQVNDCKLPYNKVLSERLNIKDSQRLTMIHPISDAKIKNEVYTSVLQNLVIFFGLKYYFPDRYNHEEILDIAFRKPVVPEEYPNLVKHYKGLRGKMTFDFSDDNIINGINLTNAATAFLFDVEKMKQTNRDFSDEANNCQFNRYALENVREMILRVFDFLEANQLGLFGEEIGKGVVDEVDYERIYMLLDHASIWIDTMVTKSFAGSNAPMVMVLSYLMGLKSSFSADFQKLTELVCYNPRENQYYSIKISAIPEPIMATARKTLDGNYEKRVIEVLDPALEALSPTVPKTVFSLMNIKLPESDMPYLGNTHEKDAPLRVPHKMLNPALLTLLSENVQLSKDLWTNKDHFGREYMLTMRGMVCYLGNAFLLESTGTPEQQADEAFAYAKQAAIILDKLDIYEALRSKLSLDLSYETLNAAYQLVETSEHLYKSDRQRMKKIAVISQLYKTPSTLSHEMAEQLRVMILRLLDSDSMSNLRALHDRRLGDVSPSVQLDYGEVITDTTLFETHFYVSDAKESAMAHSSLYIKYLLGLRSKNATLYQNLKYLGILNPRISLEQSTGGVFLIEISTFTDDYRKKIENLLGLES